MRVPPRPDVRFYISLADCTHAQTRTNTHAHTRLRDSQLVDDPQQAVPAGGALVLQLVVVEQQQGAQRLPAADDGGHILEGGGRPGEAGHCARQTGGGRERERANSSGCACVGGGGGGNCFCDRPSIAGTSAWGLARPVKGAFRSTTANRGGMSDCRADRYVCSLCSSRPCSPCWGGGGRAGAGLKNKNEKKNKNKTPTTINSCGARRQFCKFFKHVSKRQKFPQKDPTLQCYSFR